MPRASQCRRCFKLVLASTATVAFCACASLIIIDSLPNVTGLPPGLSGWHP